MSLKSDNTEESFQYMKQEKWDVDFGFNYGKLPPFLVTWRFVREMVGSAVVVSVCIYPREGGEREREREEFKTCLLHVTESQSTTFYSIFISFFPFQISTKTISVNFRVIIFYYPKIYYKLHFTL